VTVIGPDQQQYLGALVSAEALGTVLEQPADRGTGVAVLWGLCEILKRDPRAVVMLTPADHAIDSEPEYREGIRLAVRAVAERRLSPVLFGVTPSRPAPDYGWIVPAASGDAAGDQRLFRSVMAFAEKPTGPEAARLMSLGSLWNTMVLVGRADQLVELLRARFPELVDRAIGLSRATSAADEMRDIFRSWPTVDFSRDVLGSAANLSVYTWRPSLGWCDLGTESRLRDWQLRRGHQPETGEQHRPLTMAESAY
jgi:mannose-1-phosphate guanylyltransferase